jgi:hypothetical protein
MISGWFTISILSSLHFVGVNVLEGISVHKAVWAIRDVALYRGLTVINFNDFSSLSTVKIFNPLVS